MGTDFIVVSAPETFTVISEGALGPVGSQGPIGLPGDVSTTLSLSVDNELALFSGAGGKLLKRAVETGILMATNGVLSVAVPNTDYITPSTVNFTGSKLFNLLGSESIIIDGRTSIREMTLGVIRILHSAGMDGTRPITLDIDSNGFGNTKAIVVNYLANGMDPGDESHILEVIVDTDGSTGGSLQGLSVAKGGTGLTNVVAVEALQDVALLTQQTALPTTVTQAWKLSNTTYTDVTTAFSAGTDVELFSLDNDYIICGHDSIFDELTVYLAVFASSTIDALFSYSTGLNTWALFSPADGTNGFTKSGTIMWPVLAGWVPSLVNGVSKHYIRVQRTRNNIVTPPIEHFIKLSANIEFGWDKNADVSIRKLKASGIPTYADRATAEAAGLTIGQFYQTVLGAVMVV